MSARKENGHLRAVLSVAIAAAAALMAVAQQPVAQTLLLALLGGLYLVTPPSGRVPWLLAGGALLVLLLGAASLLPADWVGSSFRAAFLQRGFVLPSTASLQPWWTGEDLGLLLATFLWGWNCLENRLDDGQRQFLLAGFTLLLAVVAGLLCLHQGWNSPAVPSWVWQAGRFPNRNQTGDLLMMGGVAAAVLGVEATGKNRMAALGWAALVILFVAAALENGSRAGLLLLAAGIAVAGAWGRGPRMNLAWPAAAGILALVAVLFLTMGGPLRERLEASVWSGHDSRLPVYRDALAFLSRVSWPGIGLGNFEGVFNTVRSASRGSMYRNLHPESDWLWTGAELGWVGLLASGVVLVAALRSFFLRAPVLVAGKAARIVASLFLIHTLFDVGAHRMGTMWTCLYLVGLGAVRDRPRGDGAVPRPVMRLLGLLLLVLAGLRVQAMSAAPWMPTRGSLQAAEADLAASPSLPQQRVLLDRALGWAPLDWKLYGQRGLWSLRAQRPMAEAAADFDRALYLEQSSIELPLAIGEIYRPLNFDRAMDCWAEALARAGPRREEIYRNLFFYPGLDTKSRLELTTLAGDDPNLRVIAVVGQDGSAFDWQRTNLLANDPELEDVRTEWLRRFLQRWEEVGDAGEFLAEVPRHARWLEVAWPSYGRALAQAGQYRAAVETYLAHLPAPVLPPVTQSVAEAAERDRNAPQDPWVALQAYAAETAAGQTDEALETLRAAAQAPGAPPSLICLLARDLLGQNREEEAWKIVSSLGNPSGN